MNPLSMLPEDGSVSSEPPEPSEPPERTVPDIRDAVLVAVGIDDGGRPDVTDGVRCRSHVIEALSRLGIPAAPLDIRREDLADARPETAFATRLRDRSPSCIFNLFEGFSDDSSLEHDFCRFLEASGLPYTGNGPDALAACHDKARARVLLERGGVPVPDGICVRSCSDLAGIAFPAPFFVKPAHEDGSVGIDESSLVRSLDALEGVVSRKLLHHPDGLVVEEFLSGREFSVAFLEGAPEPVGISVIEYDHFPGLSPYLNYASKWDPKAPDFVISPRSAEHLPHALIRSIGALAARSGTVLGCRGYFRVDVRERRPGGDLRVIDVNPNPDISSDAGFARQAGEAGIHYASLIERIVALALERKREKRHVA
jgi:D-alanine-D-alanine ligase